MMYGRGYYSNDFYNNGSCFGYGFMSNGWNILIVIGVLVAIALLLYYIVHNNRKKSLNQAAMDNLKLKYVQGEITEEEYNRRKNVIDRN